MTTRHLNRAAELAPTPTSRGHATRGAWIRHYAAQALAANVTLRHTIHDLPANPQPGSRPDIGYLAALANAATAAAAALTAASPDPARAARLIYDLSPDAGALNGEWDDWLNETLVVYGINPADIDPDLSRDDFTGPTTPVVGACANHPSQFGAYAWPDGTFRCAPCTDEHRVVAWPIADTDTPCPCGNTTKAGDTYAVLDTSPASTCCAECTEAA
jgi:hypothetical protein